MPTSSSSARIHPRNRPAAGWRGVAGLGRHDPDLIVVAKGNEARERGAFCPDRDTKNNPVGCSAWSLDLLAPTKTVGCGFDIVDFQHRASGSTIEDSLVTAHKFGMRVAFSAA
jgi:hypothetical protein